MIDIEQAYVNVDWSTYRCLDAHPCQTRADLEARLECLTRLGNEMAECFKHKDWCGWCLDVEHAYDCPVAAWQKEVKGE